VIFPLERRIDAGDPVLLWRERGGPGTLPPIADVTQARENVRLEFIEFGVGHLSELHAHLGGEQLLTQCRVVVQLGVDRCGNFVEHEAQTADQHGVQKKHRNC
jgi:hypothetical protein